MHGAGRRVTCDWYYVTVRVRREREKRGCGAVWVGRYAVRRWWWVKRERMWCKDAGVYIMQVSSVELEQHKKNEARRKK